MKARPYPCSLAKQSVGRKELKSAIKKAWAWALFETITFLYDSGSTNSTSCVGKIYVVFYSVIFYYIVTVKYTRFTKH
jgi:hypothetical protein